ncbi:hypothetical protein MMC21_004672 [Puttea exsequens]|nr:hypothetical protein [Puttea exsequens]
MLGLLALLSASAPFADAISPAAIAAGVQGAKNPAVQAQQNGHLNTEGITTLDGIALDAIPEGRSAEAVMSAAITPASWTATADSFQAGNPPSNVLDGNTNTFWHSEYSPVNAALPHRLTIDMKQSYLINSVAYIPRQDGQSNGNVGQHQIQTSQDGVNFGTPVAFGTYQDSSSTKTTIFEATNARYVRFTALTEAGNRGPFTSCSSFNIFQTTTAAPSHGVGEWSPTIDFPLVPVSMAMEHDSGNLLVWSSYAASTFGGSTGGNTLTATYNPATGIVSQRNVQNTQHDMFCEGLAIDATGRFIATGGNSAAKTSIYSPRYDAWTAASPMHISRGYQSAVTLANGNMFTIGGSWSGGQGGKNGEVFNPSTNVWTLLTDSSVTPMLTADAQGIFRSDNHGWLFAWKGNAVFQAGPSKYMHWYGTLGTGGGVSYAGQRGDDGDAMCGNAVMYDAVAGKILAVGGATSYQNVDSTANANIITLGTSFTTVTTQKINPMWYQRIFANAVVLPNGKVFITGGQVYGQPFSDDTSQLIPEIWDPKTTNFVKLASQTVPRNYHSTALLLPDATVISGGGGLCGACATNHYDAQIYSPSYLFNADGSRATRPVITNTPDTINIGGTLTVTANSAIAAWTLIRIGSTTHTVNTDQRRIPLTPSGNNGNTYTIPLPKDAGIMTPGYYYLFASNAAGVPSIAKYVWVPIP